MKFKKSLRDTLIESQRGLDDMAIMAGKPRTIIDIPEKRSYEPTGNKRETDIVVEILRYLRKRKDVARVWRQNSGAVQSGQSFVRFNTARGMSDIMGIMTNGKTLAIEVKSESGRVMAHQTEFLDSITQAGGIAGVCRSVEDVRKLLGDE